MSKMLLRIGKGYIFATVIQRVTPKNECKIKLLFDMEQDYNLQNRGLVASIYEKYYTDLKQYLVSYTHNVMAAEDMLQDLFLKGDVSGCYFRGHSQEFNFRDGEAHDYR